MLSRRFQFSALSCLLLAALSSATPAHAMPVAIPLAVTAARTFEMTVDGHGLHTFTELVSVSQAHDPSVKGGAKRFTVVLRRPATNNIDISAWLELSTLDPKTSKRSASVTGIVGGNPTMRFHLTDAFPSKIEITSEGKAGVLMETVTMTCDFLQRVSV